MDHHIQLTPVQTEFVNAAREMSASRRTGIIQFVGHRGCGKSYALAFAASSCMETVEVYSYHRTNDLMVLIRTLGGLPHVYQAYSSRRENSVSDRHFVSKFIVVDDVVPSRSIAEVRAVFHDFDIVLCTKHGIEERVEILIDQMTTT